MSVNKNQVTGKFHIRVDGKLLPITGSATISGFGGKQRTSVVGDQVHGFTEAPVPAKVECTVVKKSTTSIADLTDLTDVTITVECDDGTVYTINNAWQTDAPDLSSAGEIKLVFEAADPPDETLGS